MDVQCFFLACGTAATWKHVVWVAHNLDIESPLLQAMGSISMTTFGLTTMANAGRLGVGDWFRPGGEK